MRRWISWLLIVMGALLVLGGSCNLYAQGCLPDPQPGNDCEDPDEFDEMPRDDAGGGGGQNPLSGDYERTDTDLSISVGLLEFNFTRHYHSRRTQDLGAFGYNWNWTHNEHAIIQEYVQIKRVTKDLNCVWYPRDPDTGHYYATGSRTDYFTKLVIDGNDYFVCHFRTGEKRYFDATGRLVWIEGGCGGSCRITFTYNIDGNISEVDAGNNHKVTLAYDNKKRITQIQDTAGRTVTYEYDQTTGDLIKVTRPVTDEFPNGTTIEYTYSSGYPRYSGLNHNLLTVKDSKGDTIESITYDSNDRVTQRTSGNGTITTDYDDMGRTRTVTDGNGNLTEYQYDEYNHLVKKTVMGDMTRVTEYEYNGLDMKTKEVRPNGNTIMYAYNTNHEKWWMRKLVTRKTVGNAVWDYTYEQEFRKVKTETDPNGNVTTYYYDYEEATCGDLNGDGITDQCEGKVVKKEMPAVKSGRPELDPQQIVYLYRYGSDSRKTAEVDPEGNVTLFSYTGSQLTSKGVLTGGTWYYEYDTVGNRTMVTDPNGNDVHYEYDAHRNKTREWKYVTVGGSQVTYETKYTYDENDRLVKEETKNIDGDGHTGTPTWWTKTMTYSLSGKVLTETVDIDASTTATTTYGYDGNDNVTKITYSEGNVVEYEYNALNLVTKETKDPGEGHIAAVTEYGYDGNGNRTRVTDPNGHTTTYLYNGQDQLAKTTDPLGNYTARTHDNNGNVTAVKSYNASDTLLAETKTYYDEINRVWKEEVRTSNTPTYATTAYLYDKNSRRTEVTDDDNTTTYTYDDENRLLTTTDPLGNETEYTYDDNGNVTQVTTTEKHPGESDDTFTTKKTYDELNRILTVRDQGPDGTIQNSDDHITTTPTTAEATRSRSPTPRVL